MPDEEDWRTAALTIFGVLCGFKLVTAVIVFLMQPSIGAAIFLTIFNWFMLVPPIMFGAIGLSAYGLRLLWMRVRRRRLWRAEMMADEDIDPIVTRR